MSTSRTAELTAGAAFREGALEVAPVAVGLIPFALVAGAAAVEADLGIEGAMALSSLVFAGASQLAAIDLLARDAPVVVVLATVVIINLRVAMYSAALAPRFARVPLWVRLSMAYGLVDQAFAMTLNRLDHHPERSHPVAYYCGLAGVLWGNWQVFTAVGAVVGSTLPDWLPLEATIPLVFLAILVPAVTDRATLAAAVVSGVVATLTDGLANNLGLLAGAFSGIAVGTLVALRSGRKRRTADLDSGASP